MNAMEVETNKLVASQGGELLQFLEDFWLELKRYDPLLAVLTAWGVFEEPPNFVAKRRIRLVLLITQAMYVIGMTVFLSCGRDSPSEAVVAILVIVMVTIPLEIVNAVWFRVVKSNRDVKRISGNYNIVGKFCLWSIQYGGKFIGGLLVLALFAVAVTFFILVFVGIHPNCSEQRRYKISGDIIIFQFLLVPVMMSLPYWRDQSVLLSFLGQLGPVVGLFMHVRQYGFHPAPRTPPSSPTTDSTKSDSKDTSCNEFISVAVESADSVGSLDRV